MPTGPEQLPTDLAAAHVMILAEREARHAVEAAGTAAKLALGLEVERLRLGSRPAAAGAVRAVVGVKRRRTLTPDRRPMLALTQF